MSYEIELRHTPLYSFRSDSLISGLRKFRPEKLIIIIPIVVRPPRPPVRLAPGKLFSFRRLPFTFLQVLMPDYAFELYSPVCPSLAFRAVNLAGRNTFPTCHALISVNIFMAALTISLARIRSDKFRRICNSQDCQ